MDVFAALQGFKTVLDGVKAVSDTRDEAMRNNASIELTRKLIDLQGEMMSALQANATMADLVRSLKAEVADLKARASDLSRYELKNIGDGAVAYMLKPEARGTEPAHWLCPTCYGNGKQSVFNRSSEMPGQGYIYRCSGCKAQIMTWSVPAWSNAPQPIIDDRPTCRFCRTGRLDLISSEADPIFGDVGLKLDTLKCNNAACGKTDTRQFDPMQR